MSAPPKLEAVPTHAPVAPPELAQVQDKLQAAEKTLNEWRTAGACVTELTQQLDALCRFSLQRITFDPNALCDVVSMLVLCTDRIRDIEDLIYTAEPDAHVLIDERPATKLRGRLLLAWCDLGKQATDGYLKPVPGTAAPWWSQAQQGGAA